MNSNTVFYRLKQIDFDGTYSYSNTVEVTGIVPNEFALKQNYPNPFNPSTKIEYQLPSEEKVSIRIFDILGNEVAQLVNEKIAAGVHTVEFDAANLPSGIYFYQISAGQYSQTKKLMLLK